MSVILDGVALRRALNERGLSQAELAKRADLTPETITNIVKGRPAAPETIARIDAVLSRTPILGVVSLAESAP